MDDGVEMVKPGSGVYEVVGPDDLEEIPTRIPAENGRRKMVFFCGVTILLALGVAALGKIYLTPDQLTAGDQVYIPEEGDIGNDVDGAKEAEAEGKVQNHKGHDASEEFIRNHGQKEDTPKEDNEHEKVQKWLDANVTLSDGQQYEVIVQLKHAKDAFT